MCVKAVPCPEDRTSQHVSSSGFYTLSSVSSKRSLSLGMVGMDVPLRTEHSTAILSKYLDEL